MMMGREGSIGGGGEGGGREKSCPGQGPLGDAYPEGFCVFGGGEAKAGFNHLLADAHPNAICQPGAPFSYLIEDLRMDMNNRFADLRAEMNGRFADLRTDMNRRFDDVNSRFNDVMTLLQIIISTLVALVLAIAGAGFVLWRKILAVDAAVQTKIGLDQAVREQVLHLEQEMGFVKGKLKELSEALGQR